MRPGPLVVFLAIAALLDATRDLAGPFSRVTAILPLLLGLASLVHLAASWFGFTFHEEYSTDHPRKGDTITYALHLRNGLPVPAALGLCVFSSRGPLGGGLEPLPLELGAGEYTTRTHRIRCAYRGIYVIGARSIRFRGTLGLLEVEHSVEPRVFHVYPELVQLSPRVDRLGEGGAGGRTVMAGGDPDPGVFDGLRPLEHHRPARRIAWKKWAATGIPSEIAEGRSATEGLRVVLDLRPPVAEEEDRLAAEDLAVTAAYSVLARLVQAGIPAELVLGGEETGRKIDTPAAFEAAYEVSTSVLFKDTSFPAAALAGDMASLLVSARPLAEADPLGGMDLFGALELACSRSLALTVFEVPPPATAERERERAFTVYEGLLEGGRTASLRVLDPRNGTQDLLDAFPL